MPDTLTMTYCAGWDTNARNAIGAASVSWAAARDAAGQPYSVLLADNGAPFVVLDIARAAGYYAVWQLQDRRRRRYDGYRDIDGRLFRLEYTFWEAGDDEPERGFDQARYELDGNFSLRMEMPDGRLRTTGGRQDPDDSWVDRPDFGDWLGLLTHAKAVSESEDMVLSSAPDPAGDQPTAEPNWTPPAPAAVPATIADWFAPGRRFEVSDRRQVVVSVRPAGELLLPTGALVAAEPDWTGADTQPFDERLKPGSYRVELAVADLGYETRVAAARLLVSPEPPTSWELAVTDGQNARLLGNDQFYGFGVDSGTAGFFDAAARSTLDDQYSAHEGQLTAMNAGDTVSWADPESGATVLVFNAGYGDGVYPTWLGRTASGEPACFVIDLEVLRNARPAD